jgi:hypothetical protein
VAFKPYALSLIKALECYVDNPVDTKHLQVGRRHIYAAYHQIDLSQIPQHLRMITGIHNGTEESLPWHEFNIETVPRGHIHAPFLYTQGNKEL